MNELRVTLEPTESGHVLRPAGRIDSNTAPRFQEVLLQAVQNPDGTLRIDLAEVPYMNSAGLRVLLLVAKALQKRGERLKLINVPPQIGTALKQSGFTGFIDVVS